MKLCSLKEKSISMLHCVYVLWKYMKDTQQPMHTTTVYEQVCVMQFIEKGFNLK